MTLVVPDQLDGLGALVESLTPERLNRILRGFDPHCRTSSWSFLDSRSKTHQDLIELYQVLVPFAPVNGAGAQAPAPFGFDQLIDKLIGGPSPLVTELLLHSVFPSVGPEAKVLNVLGSRG
ncbi:hypothetical protein MTO96_005474 [Rhipicephalus appendiculatus]